MTVGQSFEVIGGILDFTYVKNTGVGFGMLDGVKWVPILAASVVLVGVILIWRQLRPMPMFLAITLALFCAGAAGNLIDRLVYGYVVDLFDLAFIRFPVFNVADILINVGCALLIGWLIFGSGKSVVEDTQDKASEASMLGLQVQEVSSDEGSIADTAIPQEDQALTNKKFTDEAQ
jgi:signal peptidase II